MRSLSSPRDKHRREATSPLPIQTRGKPQRALPPLREAIPEIRDRITESRGYSDYPQQLHHDPPGPSRYPTTPSLGPSPPTSRSRFPPSSSSSSHRLTNGHHSQDPYDRSRMPQEMHLPMHSGPPSRNSGSPSSSGYIDTRSLASTNTSRTPDRAPVMNGKSPETSYLPPIHALTHSTAPYAQSRLPPLNSSMPPGVNGAYPRSIPPQPPHMDPHYSYGYAAHPHDPHGSMGRPVEFHQVDGSEKSHKKRRGNLPKHTTDVLRSWLHDHLDHAYPNEDQKQQLIRETGLSDKQVSNWFINARRRNLPRLVGQAQAESKLMASQPSSSQSPSDDNSPGRR